MKKLTIILISFLFLFINCQMTNRYAVDELDLVNQKFALLSTPQEINMLNGNLNAEIKAGILNSQANIDGQLKTGTNYSFKWKYQESEIETILPSDLIVIKKAKNGSATVEFVFKNNWLHSTREHPGDAPNKNPNHYLKPKTLDQVVITLKKTLFAFDQIEMRHNTSYWRRIKILKPLVQAAFFIK